MRDHLTTEQQGRLLGFCAKSVRECGRRWDGVGGCAILRRGELAKVFLKTTTWDITRVARESGFASRGWFSQVFRTHTGCTPGQYRGTDSNPGHAAAG
ncbi:MAG: helix-turn-helix domain-containing protein [bacterium]|nr:helix-turn-helix domain-containing protein [bacterium]